MAENNSHKRPTPPISQPISINCTKKFLLWLSTATMATFMCLNIIISVVLEKRLTSWTLHIVIITCVMFLLIVTSSLCALLHMKHEGGKIMVYLLIEGIKIVIMFAAFTVGALAMNEADTWGFKLKKKLDEGDKEIIALVSLYLTIIVIDITVWICALSYLIKRKLCVCTNRGQFINIESD